ncbi:MAG: hypothetical protein ACRELT_12430, partial [Longimicrobiales bacterium]
MTDHTNLPAPMDGSPNGLGPYYAQPPLPDEAGQGGGVNLKRYLTAVLRYKWLVLLLVTLGTVGGWYLGRFVELSYRAQATVILGTTSRQDMDQGPIQSSDLLDGADWLALLRSFEVLDYVAWEERLYLEHATKDSALMRTFSVDTMFMPGDYRLRVSKDGGRVELLTGEGVQVGTTRPGEPIGADRGFKWQPEARLLRPGRVADLTVLTPREAAIALGKGLGANLPRGSSFIAINYQAQSPTAAASVVNTIVSRFIGVSTRLKNA